MTLSDIIYAVVVLGFVGFIILHERKKKKKKAMENNENGIVQTSELYPASFSGSTVPRALGSGGGLCAYPIHAQSEVLVFNLRDPSLQTADALQLAISAKLDRLLLDLSDRDRQPFFQYVPVGTTLIVICVYAL